MHISVAVPTYNRCNYLKTNIKHFLEQHKPDGLTLSMSISNTASTDTTSAFLDKFASLRDDIFINNEPIGWTHGNFGGLLKALPSDADWVWLMGDDDYLYSPDSIETVYNVIKSHEHDSDFAFVHACQARRSKNSGNVYVDNVLNLCKELGYLEVLGWFSSLIVRRDVFEKALARIHQIAWNCEQAFSGPQGITYSAFLQSAELLHELHDKNGAFIDAPLAEPQDEVQTHETVQRWTAESMAERYFLVVDDLLGLRERGLPIENLAPSFFRYHQFSLWDRLIHFQLACLLNLSKEQDSVKVKAILETYEKNWTRIQCFPKFLAGEAFKKSVFTSITSCMDICELYINSKFDPVIEEKVRKQIGSALASIYSFDLFWMEIEAELAA